jgi:hypothetical protein
MTVTLSRTLVQSILLALLGVGVITQPLNAWTRLGCIPGATCAVAGQPGPACRSCCHPKTPAAIVRPNCCILHQGVPVELRADRQLIVAAVLHSPPPEIVTIRGDSPRLHIHLEDSACWVPPWAIAPEQGRGARPPPVL